MRTKNSTSNITHHYGKGRENCVLMIYIYSTIVFDVHRNHFRVLLIFCTLNTSHFLLLLPYIYLPLLIFSAVLFAHFNLRYVFYCWGVNTLYDQTALNEKFCNVWDDFTWILSSSWIATVRSRDELLLKCKTFFCQDFPRVVLRFFFCHGIFGISTSVYSQVKTIRNARQTLIWFWTKQQKYRTVEPKHYKKREGRKWKREKNIINSIFVFTKYKLIQKNIYRHFSVQTIWAVSIAS